MGIGFTLACADQEKMEWRFVSETMSAADMVSEAMSVVVMGQSYRATSAFIRCRIAFMGRRVTMNLSMDQIHATFRCMNLAWGTVNPIHGWDSRVPGSRECNQSSRESRLEDSESHPWMRFTRGHDARYPPRATSAAAARSPVVFNTFAKRARIASTAIRIPIPSAGRPIARNSGVSMMNAPRGIPGTAKARKTAANAIVARPLAWIGMP